MMTNQKLRQAMQAATSMEPVLSASVGPKQLWALNGALMPQGTKWFSKVGIGRTARVRRQGQYAGQEAGYKGEPIRFMTTVPDHSAPAPCSREQRMRVTILTCRSMTGDSGVAARQPG
jgi:hypothetical protein